MKTKFYIALLFACLAYSIPCAIQTAKADDDEGPKILIDPDAHDDDDDLKVDFDKIAKLPDGEIKKGAIEGQSIGQMEWSDDQGDHWHPVSGKDAKAIPPVLKNYTIGFRVIKSAPDVEWPDDPFRPRWALRKFGEKGIGTFIGDEIWVMWETIPPKGTPAAIIVADCGNEFKVTVNEIYEREEEKENNDKDDNEKEDE